MRLNYRIWIGLGTLLTVWMLSLGVSFSTIKRLEADYQRAVDETLPMVIALEDLRFAALRIVASTSEYGFIATLSADVDLEVLESESNEQEENEEEEIEEGIQGFQVALNTYDAHTQEFNIEKVNIRQALGTQGDLLEATSGAIVDAIEKSELASEVLELKEELEGIERDILEITNAEVAHERRNLEARHAEIDNAIASGVRNIILSAIVALGGIVISTVISTYSVVRPIERLTKAAQQLANGEFVSLPKAKGAYEISSLTNAFGVMSENLQRVIEKHRSAADAATRSEQRFRDIAESSSDWIWETDADHTISFMSERFLEVTGLNRDEVVGKAMLTLLSPDRSADFSGSNGFDFDTHLPIRNFRSTYNDIDGHLRICRISGKAVFGSEGAFTGYRGTATDVTAEVEAQNKAEHMALHDALTGLPNRVLMAERLKQNLERMERQGGNVGVICLDLDHFKEVNDTLGHAAGDALLQAVALRLEAEVRSTDTVARLGGDEFAIVQSDANQPANAETLCRRILKAIEEPFEIEGQAIHTGVSIGVALAPMDGSEYNLLLKNADVAMYRAKKEGRNSYRFFEAGMDAELQHRKSMERDLREAIRKDQLEVYYQPIVDTVGKDIIGVEALVRWHRAEMGMISPADFIPLAEETGLILDLGEWVLRTACKQAKVWPNLFVAVNLSPVQFRQPDLVGLVDRVLKETGLSPSRLELEITEGVLIQDTDLAVTILDGLKELGVRIAMDDFGTGYSSLSYLQRFKFDKIKLDQSFVQSLEVSGEASAIVKAVLGLGKSLGMTTTAEGVESSAQLDFLSGESCDQLQGYYLNKPTTNEQITELLGGASQRQKAS